MNLHPIVDPVLERSGDEHSFLEYNLQSVCIQLTQSHSESPKQIFKHSVRDLLYKVYICVPLNMTSFTVLKCLESIFIGPTPFFNRNKIQITQNLRNAVILRLSYGCIVLTLMSFDYPVKTMNQQQYDIMYLLV